MFFKQDNFIYSTQQPLDSFNRQQAIDNDTYLLTALEYYLLFNHDI